MLWFGDERGYNATTTIVSSTCPSCGLVMKEDITQLLPYDLNLMRGCGLVMKEDITQQHCVDFRTLIGCGLVMKENVPCCQQTAQKKYPWILGNVSLDKRASIQGYFAK